MGHNVRLKLNILSIQTVFHLRFVYACLLTAQMKSKYDNQNEAFGNFIEKLFRNFRFSENNCCRQCKPAHDKYKDSTFSY